MEEITLQFRSLDDLWAFRIDALISFIGMNADKLLLTCRCSKASMQLALSKYKAIVFIQE